MNKITWFKNYAQELQDTINGINSNRVVLDNSMVTKYLENHQSSYNALLVAVMPDFGSKGTNVDDYKSTAKTQLMILKKTTYSEYDYEAFIGIFEEMYSIVEDVLKKLINDATSGCNYLRFLNVSSIAITPVWDYNHCNGWSISFNFDMTL